LTEEGAVLLRYANAVLSLLEQVDSEFGTLRSKQIVEPLKIGGSYGASTRLLPSLVARFKKTTSGDSNCATIRVEQNFRKNVVELRSGNSFGTYETGQLSASRRTFSKRKTIVFVARSHRLASKKTVSVSDLNVSQLARPEEETARLRKY
jgi:DNA-binding transcriptional LysR family regulator